MKFAWTKKNIILISVSCVLAVLLAVLTVILIIKLGKNKINELGSSYFSSAFSQQISSEQETGLVITSPVSLDSTVTTSKTVI
ncbi:MAG: hypothetical protein IJ948_02810, partial [Clostridia bacterium]|nr:hypothetical protein [Clostridia bacterium]